MFFMEHLHPGAMWLFRIQTYIGLFFVFIILGIWLSMALILVVGAAGVMVGLVSAIILIVAISELYARLAYPRWKFEITKEGVKIEKGIIWKVYKSIPYTRVQNVDIRRGILARMLGFSTLNIQTAGYSGGGHRGGRIGAEGHIPAVGIKRAEEIRTLLMKKIGKRAAV